MLQPPLPSLARGLFATLLILAFALAVSLALSPAAMDSWVSLIMVSMVPTQMVIGLLWQGRWPVQLASWPQPWRGLGHAVMTLCTGAVIAFLALHFVGGNITPPTPFVVMYLIFSVPVTLALILVFQGWPFTRLCRNPGLQGVALLLSAYVLAWVLFRKLFDFSFASSAPFYLATLDPKGLLTAWYPLSASLAALVFMLLLALLDFWPAAKLSKLLAMPAHQPWAGVSATLCIALGTGISWLVFVNLANMDIVVFMTRVCVATIFGIFILLVMLEGLPHLAWPQPLRGLALGLLAVILGQAMYLAYRYLATLRFGLESGSPGYAMDLWLAGSMLAVTFPAMVFFAQYFQFWPLLRQPAGARQ